MKKKNIFQNKSQEILTLFEIAGNRVRVMCVPMDYAQKNIVRTCKQAPINWIYWESVKCFSVAKATALQLNPVSIGTCECLSGKNHYPIYTRKKPTN